MANSGDLIYVVHVRTPSGDDYTMVFSEEPDRKAVLARIPDFEAEYLDEVGMLFEVYAATVDHAAVDHQTSRGKIGHV